MDVFVFADEAGCFTFNRQPNVSRYFVLCTITAKSCDFGLSLHDLRRNLVWQREELGDFFHCSDDRNKIRSQVFQLLSKQDFSIQATICEKSKALPELRATRARFYQSAWYYHFRHGLKGAIASPTRLLVTAASLRTRREKLSFANALGQVVGDSVKENPWAMDFRPAATDPCLQAADYCAWAIQRKWERGDEVAYNIISSKITYEYDLWYSGQTHFY